MKKKYLLFFGGFFLASILIAGLTLFVPRHEIRPGQTFHVEIGRQRKAPVLHWDQQQTSFYISRSHKWRALARVPLDALPGEKQLFVETFLGKSSKSLNIRLPVFIVPSYFGFETITFDAEKAKLLNDPSEDEESRLIREYLALADQDKKQHWKGKFIKPVKGDITSLYGVTRKKVGQEKFDFHRGIDQTGELGEPIKAANGGIVLMAKNFKFHGKTILLSHGQGIGTIYIHMSEMDVEEGDVVKKKQIIGKVGSTGLATGPHLHWGLYVHGKAVDPVQWLEEKF